MPFMPEYAIGLDLGGTNLRAAAIDRAGHVLDRRSAATDPAAGREAMLGHMVNAIAELRGACGSAGLAGIGIGVPGFILLKLGVIRNSNNLACLEDFPIRDEIEHRLNAHVILENDANAAALGEKWMGAGRDVDDLVLLTQGTGVGGGIISGGKVLQGYLGMAGELARITVVPNGNPCGCGNQGCLEKHASATAVTALANMLRLGENLSAREVYDLALAGNEKAARIFVSMGQALGVALATLVNAFKFPCICSAAACWLRGTCSRRPCWKRCAGAPSSSAPPPRASRRLPWAMKRDSTARPACPGWKRLCCTQSRSELCGWESM
jgi:glucokinase